MITTASSAMRGDRWLRCRGWTKPGGDLHRDV
jgi:hypothetical protein